MACYTTTVASLIAAGLAAIRLKHLVFNYLLYVITRQVPPPTFVEYSNSTSTIETAENDLTDLKLMEDAAIELPHQNLDFQTRTNECGSSILLRNAFNYSCEISLYKNKRGIGWLTYHVRDTKAEIIRRNDIAV